MCLCGTSQDAGVSVAVEVSGVSENMIAIAVCVGAVVMAVISTIHVLLLLFSR